jgi:hypothetical protein
MNDLSQDEYVISFSIFGLPRSGKANIVTSLTHLPPTLSATWNPTYTVGDFSNVIALLNSTLTALPQAEVNNARTQVFPLWLQIETSPMRLTSSGVEAGTVIDDCAQREAIRVKFGELIGFTCPFGGFTQSAKDSYSRQMAKFGGGLGDR